MGLLGYTERKNGWQLAESMYDAEPQGMQRLLNAAHWDEAGGRAEIRHYLGRHLGEGDGILMVNETGYLKNGTKSAGVARQYSGTTGRIENQQLGVFLPYASSQGCAFLDCALYLPEEWLKEPERC
jgi:SRSO17 transposase